MEKCTRKLIKIGSTLLVSIPKGYAKFFDLQPGDKVEVVTTKVVTIKPLKQVG
jgi:antitoxin component of MazEF toxin-antitoxin module